MRKKERKILCKVGLRDYLCFGAFSNVTSRVSEFFVSLSSEKNATDTCQASVLNMNICTKEMRTNIPIAHQNSNTISTPSGLKCKV